MKPFRRVLFAALAAVVLLGANGAHAGAVDQPKSFFVLGTGYVDGLYYPVGQAICRLFARLSLESQPGDAKPAIRCSAQPSGGSIDNINHLAKDRFDFAIVQSDVVIAAFNGKDGDQIPNLEKLRAFFSLHSEPFQLVVSKSSGISNFADLRGKRVNIGAPGSGHRELMESLMRYYHLSPADFAKVSELPPGQQAAQALCNGEIDAFAVVVGAPDGNVARATDDCGARLIPVQDAPAVALAKEIPGYERVTIPRGMYVTTTTDIPTIGVIATLVTTADEDPELVYQVTKTVMENLNEIRGFNPALGNLKPETMIRKGIDIPLHPGAERYYKERGWLSNNTAGR